MPLLELEKVLSETRFFAAALSVTLLQMQYSPHNTKKLICIYLRAWNPFSLSVVKGGHLAERVLSWAGWRVNQIELNKRSN
eukprot:scaffold10156_cov98-Skeletonema_dohrnii-CCMP3373.AAC.6